MCMTCGKAMAPHKGSGGYVPKKANAANPFKINSTSANAPKGVQRMVSNQFYGSPGIRATNFKLGR